MSFNYATTTTQKNDEIEIYNGKNLIGSTNRKNIFKNEIEGQVDKKNNSKINQINEMAFSSNIKSTMHMHNQTGREIANGDGAFDTTSFPKLFGNDQGLTEKDCALDQNLATEILCNFEMKNLFSNEIYDSEQKLDNKFHSDDMSFYHDFPIDLRNSKVSTELIEPEQRNDQLDIYLNDPIAMSKIFHNKKLTPLLAQNSSNTDYIEAKTKFSSNSLTSDNDQEFHVVPHSSIGKDAESQLKDKNPKFLDIVIPLSPILKVIDQNEIYPCLQDITQDLIIYPDSDEETEKKKSNENEHSSNDQVVPNVEVKVGLNFRKRQFPQTEEYLIFTDRLTEE